ncbi:MAG: mandelate racemase/muconate lactonizing enzyme family protein [Christensenellaceae bacterium]|nr:mandelate racemase/muconate lactonizing enzyme family protein [Christensenellaceae bacterium]
MKITSVDILALKKDPAGTRPIICRVNTDEGFYGLGEAGVGIGSGARGAFELLKDFAPMIIGMDPMYNEVIWEKIFKQSFWGQGNGAILMAALSAIDVALWDIKGKAFNVPVYQLLGGKQRDKLRAYASQLQFGWKVEEFNPMDAGAEVEFYKEAAQKAIEDGYDAIKVNFMRFDRNGKLFNHLRTTGYLSREIMDIAEERLAAVREVVGPKVDIIAENHAMTDAHTAIQFGKMAAKYDIMYLEEACTPLNPGVMKKVADNIEIPLAGGERTYTRWGFLPFLENGSLAMLQPDIGNCGGLTEAKKIADMAHVYDVGIQSHVCTSPVGVAASLHLEAAIPNFIIHEHHFANTTPSIINQCEYDYQPIDGYFQIPEIPGIGQELSKMAIDTAEIVTIN